MDQVVVQLLLQLLALGCATGNDVCSQTPGPAIADGSLEAHMEERTAGSAPQQCEARLERPSPVSRIEVTSVMFSLGNRCGEQQQQLEQQPAGQPCASAASYLRINGRDVCACRSADEYWQPFYADSLDVLFHRESPSAASFAVTYRVQSCDLTKLKRYGGYETVDAFTFDRVVAYCKDSSLVDADGKPTNRTRVMCHFENGTWEHAQRCDAADPTADDSELPPSQEVVQHKPSRFHTDDDGDGHFPKELVGGLAFVLVILVVVVIGATIYTVKRRYKVIVVRRPSRAASTNSRRGSSLTNGGSKAGRASAAAAAAGTDPDDEESAARAAEERLLQPSVRPSAYGPAPGSAYAVYGPAPGCGEHEYATPFDPAVGTWSLPSGQPPAALNSAPAPAPAAAAVGEKAHYFVLENVPAATS